MGVRFRKSMKIGGARVSLSKSGVGASFGVKGARYSVHSSGRRTTSVGIPGTGLSYVSSSSSGNKPSRQSNSPTRNTALSQQHRLNDRHANKIQLASERRNKALNKLKEVYAAGKITSKQYNELKNRDSNITVDLMIFGRSAGVKLAERYLLGKIDANEFESLKNEILGQPESEKDRIIDDYKKIVDRLSDFVISTRSKISDQQCNYCGKQKGFFSPLHSVSNFKLCSSCRLQYRRLQNYPGFAGRFYQSQNSVIDPDLNNSLVLNIRLEHILNYR